MLFKLKYLLISLSLFSFSASLWAQEETMESLSLELKNAKHDTTRIKLLTALSELAEVDQVLQYALPCEKLCNEGLKTYPNNVFYLRYLSDAINNRGFVAEQEGESRKALEYYNRSLKIKEQINDQGGIAIAFNNMGVIYKNFGNITKALDYYHRSLKISEAINDKSLIALALDNIGAVFSSQGEYQKALEYYYRDMKLYEETKEPSGVALAFNNMGYVYSCLGDDDKSLEYYQKSLKIYEEINEKQGITASLNNIAQIYKGRGDFPKALEIYSRTLKLYQDINDKSGIAHTMNHMANAYFEVGQTEKALTIAKQAFKLTQELGYPNDINTSARILKLIYKKQNNFKEALAMYELQVQMRDSINNTKTKNESIKKQFQYQYEKKAAADSVKNAEEQKVKNAQLTAQQAQLKQEKTQRFALYGGLILVIAFSGFVYNRFRLTQKQKHIIEQQKVIVDEAYLQLEEKNKEVMDSIHYAKRIQTALLPSEQYIERKLNELN